MKSFSLKIVTPDGLQFDGQAEELVVRTVDGDMGVMAGHINCVTALGMGRALIVTEGKRREAACIGGMLTVLDGNVTLVPTTFEWAETIDVRRAAAAEARARKALEEKERLSKIELRIAEAHLKRSLVRQNVAADSSRHT